MRELLKGKNSELGLKNQLIAYLLFAVLMLIYYSNSIQNGYSLDDDFIYTTNTKANQGLANFSEIFTASSFDYGSFEYGYRPITVLSFALENEVFGINSTASHAFNLLLYLLAVVFLFKTMVRLFPDLEVKYSLLIASLFLILPIHSEIVNNVKCRDELLMLLFGLMASYYWLKGSSNRLFYGLAIFALVLGILSKKTTFIFLGILPLLSYYQSDGEWKKGLKTFLIMVLPVVFFKLITKFVKDGKSDRIYSFVENPLFDPAFDGSKLTIIAESCWFYLQNMLFPTQLVSYYGYDTIPFKGMQFTSILAILFIVFLSVLGIRGLLKKEPHALGILILLGGLLPVVNLFMPMVGIVAERFATVSTIGLCIALVLGAKHLMEISKGKKWKSISLIALLGYSLIYLMLIRSRNAEWDSLNSLAKADYKKEPKSINLNKILANMYFVEAAQTNRADERNQRGRKSLELYNYVLKSYPSKETYNEKGTLLFKLYQQVPEAEAVFKKALELDPNYTAALKNLGILYMDTGRGDQAEYYFMKTLGIASDQIDVYVRLVRLLADAGRPQDAIRWLDDGLTKNGQQYDLLLSKGHLYLSTSNAREALNWYQKAYSVKQSQELQMRILQIQNQLK